MLGLLSSNVDIWRRSDELLVHPDRSKDEAHELIAPLRRIQSQEPYSRINAWMQLAAMAKHETNQRLGQLRMPVEVIAGVGDQVLPTDSARVLARHIPQSKLTILEGVGHEIPLEAPQAIFDSLLRLLALPPTSREGETD